MTTKAEAAAIHNGSLSGLDKFIIDAQNPDIVGAARDAAIAKQAGVDHVANRAIHAKLG